MADQKPKSYCPYAYKQVLSPPSAFSQPKELQGLILKPKITTLIPTHTKKPTAILPELETLWRQTFLPRTNEELLLVTNLSLLDHKEGIVPAQCFISRHYISFILGHQLVVPVCISLRQIESWSQANKKLAPGIPPFVRITAPVTETEIASAIHIYTNDRRLHMLFDIVDCKYEHFCSVFDCVWRSIFQPGTCQWTLKPSTSTLEPESFINQNQFPPTTSPTVSPPRPPNETPPSTTNEKQQQKQQPMKTITQASTVNEVVSWLISMQMSQYADVFKDQEINGEAFSFLTESDLVNLGINKIGHKKIILNAIAKLNNVTTPSPILL